jgi:hypothetical protein
MRIPKTHKPKTHFEQVPLEVVQKIVKEHLEREIPDTEGIGKETAENCIAWPDEPSPARGGNLMTRGFRATKL